MNGQLRLDPEQDRRDLEQAFDRHGQRWPAPSRWRLLARRWLLPLLVLVVAMFMSTYLHRPEEETWPASLHFWPFYYAIGVARWIGGREVALTVWAMMVAVSFGIEYRAMLDLNWPVLVWILFAGFGPWIAVVGPGSGPGLRGFLGRGGAQIAAGAASVLRRGGQAFRVPDRKADRVAGLVPANDGYLR